MPRIRLPLAMRGWRVRGGRDVRQLAQMSDRAFWASRGRRFRRRSQRSVLRLALRARARLWIDDCRTAAAQVLLAKYGLLTALLLLVASEAFAAEAHDHRFLVLHLGLDTRLIADSYEGFTAAVVGALAVLLALFFTTVGVVATTKYADVPGAIRQLFVHERGNVVYINAVARALVFGIALLLMRAVGYRPYSLSIVVFAVLSVLSVLSLIALGTGLFNFFDLSSLAAPLPRQFGNATALACVSGDEIPDFARQESAHDRAASALRVYRQVIRLLTASKGGDSESSTSMIAGLIGMWDRYSLVKGSIPPGSGWFPQEARYPDSLTLDPFQLQMQLSTASPALPGAGPDLLWAEREISHDVAELTALLLAGPDRETAALVMSWADTLIRRLAQRFQIREALLFAGEFASTIDQIVRPASPDSHGTGSDQRSLMSLQLGAAEYGVLARTELWLGVVDAARAITLADLRTVIDAAVTKPHGPYGVAAVAVPAGLRAELAKIARGIETERHVQRIRVTPPWWVHDQAGRILALSLRDMVNEVIGAAEEYITARLKALAADDRPGSLELRVVLIFAGLQLVNRLTAHGAQVQQAAEAIAGLRHAAADSGPWPATAFDQRRCIALEVGLVRSLAAAIPALPEHPHAGTGVDLFGRAYHMVVDAVFKALIQGRNDLAAEIFPAAMDAAFRARDRLTADFADQPARILATHQSGPLVDLMEISGYALFLHELDGNSTWPAICPIWDGWTADPQQVAGLASILAARHQLVPADMRRSGWQQQFDTLLEEHGLPRRTGGGLHRSPPAPPHPSPVVAGVLAEGHSSPYEMADLFLVEYLATRPGGTDLTLTPPARWLRAAIQAARQRAAGDDIAPGRNAGGDEDDL
jgi:hypothetical protein